jgi:hypothetical protein
VLLTCVAWRQTRSFKELIVSRPIHVAAAEGPALEPLPVVAMYQASPWVGTLVRRQVYEDGTVIVYEPRDGEPGARPVEGRVAPEVARALASEVHEAIGRPEVRRDCPAEDGPWTWIAARTGNDWAVDHAHGVIDGADLCDAGHEEPWSRFSHALRTLRALTPKDAHPWVPRSVDVTLLPLSSPGAEGFASIDWPDSLPALPPLDAQGTADGVTFSVPQQYAETVRSISRRVGMSKHAALSVHDRRWQVLVDDHWPGNGVPESQAIRESLLGDHEDHVTLKSVLRLVAK